MYWFLTAHLGSAYASSQWLESYYSALLYIPYGLCWNHPNQNQNQWVFVKLQVLGLRLGVDFTFTLDNNENNDNNPHLNFFKGTVPGVKEQGLGLRDKR